MGDVDNTNSLLDLLKLTSDKTSELIKVSTLAKVKSIKTQYSEGRRYGVLNVAPFPLNKNESEYDIIAYYFSNIDFKENDIVLIVFTDLYFADNLNNLDAIVPTSKTIRHTSSNAVAIKI